MHYSKKYLTIFIALIGLKCFGVNTQIATAVRFANAPKIDALFDDECWKSCKMVDDFTQRLPLEGKQPTQKTEVYIGYDDDAIYVFAKMFDTKPDSIFNESGIRDAENLNADNFRFVIDPYQKLQDFFEFGVYASGAQFDKKYTDVTYNAVWYSAVQINNEGWFVEYKIPYSAFRFPKKNVQEWNMQSTRTIKRKQEFIQWCLTPSGNSNSLAFFGKLQGIKSIKAPLRLFFTPYISGYANKNPEYDDNGNLSYATSLNYNAGADIKYGIDNRFTLDLTLLPDFGQTQSDSKVKNLGYQEIAYDENRPFFLEGTELFGKDRLFYSRRIGQAFISTRTLKNSLNDGQYIVSNPTQTKLINAAKLSGRTNGGLGIGLFNAVTDNTFASIKDSLGQTRRVLTLPLTNYNVFVAEQQLKNNSNIYFMNTSAMRNGAAYDADLSAVGFSFANKENTYAIDGTSAVSNKITTDNETQKINDVRGLKYSLGIRKTAGTYQWGISRTGIDSKFYSSDLGYQTINNTNKNNINFSHNLYKPKGIFRDANNYLSFDYETNYLTKKLSNAQLTLNLNATLLKYHAVFCGAGFTPWQGYDYFEPRAPGRYSRTLRYYFVYAGFATDRRKKLSLNISQNTSNFIDMFRIDGYNTDVGIRYRFNNQFKISYSFSRYYDPFNFGYTRTDENGIVYGGRKLITYENRLTLNYIIKTNMQLNLVARHYWNTGEYRKYFLLQDDGNYTEHQSAYNSNFSYNALNIDLTYTYIFSPGSSFIINVKKAIESDAEFTNYNYKNNFRTTTQAPKNTSVSIKFLYYLDWLVIKKALA